MLYIWLILYIYKEKNLSIKKIVNKMLITLKKYFYETYEK